MYVYELKANFKSLLVWAAIIALLVFIAVAKYAVYAENPELLAVLDAVPQGMLKAFDMLAFSLTTLTGLFGVMFAYFGLMGALAAVMWGSDIIAKEERNKTVEFSLVLPVKRSWVVTAKALAALTNCVFFVLLTWAVSLAAVQKYAPDRAFREFLVLEMQAMLMIELVFLALGLFLGASMRRYKFAGSAGLGVVLVTYFASVVSGMFDELEFLRWFTPFEYFDAASLYRHGHLESLSVLIAAAFIVVLLAATYWVYNRRDLYV